MTLLEYIQGFREPATTGALWDEIAKTRKFANVPMADLPATFAELEAGVKALAVAGLIEADREGNAELWRPVRKAKPAERTLFS